MHLAQVVLATMGMMAMCTAGGAASGIIDREPWGDGWERVTYVSDALQQEQHFLVVRPDGAPPPSGWPVLLVLHGHGRSHLTLWEHEETRALLTGLSFFVVLPDTGRGWWIDSPVDSESRCGQALDEVIMLVADTYPVAKGRDFWGIAGWSMGGYGAMCTAQRRPQQFGFVGTIIGLLDFPRWQGLPENQRYRVPQSIFGEDQDRWETLNPINAVEALRYTKVLVIGADAAFDRTMNQNFLAAAKGAGVEVTAEWIRGGHTFPVVAEGLPRVLAAARAHFPSTVASGR